MWGTTTDNTEEAVSGLAFEGVSKIAPTAVAADHIATSSTAAATAALCVTAGLGMALPCYASGRMGPFSGSLKGLYPW